MIFLGDFMQLLDGKKLQKELLPLLKEKYNKLERKLTLVVFLIGKNLESLSYIRQKEKIAQYLDCHFVLKQFDTIDELTLLSEIEQMNQDPLVDGILIQLPLPDSLSKEVILNKVAVFKDVDGLHEENRRRLANGEECFIPCTPKAIMDLLKYNHISFKNKKVAILGRSILVGKPLEILMKKEGGIVTLLHSKSEEKEEILLQSDIVVSAVGKPNLIRGNMLKKDTVLIDVGTNYVDGKLVGDVNTFKVEEKCSYLSPVPGGVGPMTVYELFSNLYEAYKKRQ